MKRRSGKASSPYFEKKISCGKSKENLKKISCNVIVANYGSRVAGGYSQKVASISRGLF